MLTPDTLLNYKCIPLAINQSTGALGAPRSDGLMQPDNKRTLTHHAARTFSRTEEAGQPMPLVVSHHEQCPAASWRLVPGKPLASKSRQGFFVKLHVDSAD